MAQRFGGSWSKIVKPLGWTAIYMHIASFTNLVIFSQWASHQVKMEKEARERELAEGGGVGSASGVASKVRVFVYTFH